MPTPNADRGPDPQVPSSSMDPRFSPDAGEAAFIDIPAAPATLANMKLADPDYSIGSAGDHAGITDAAVREGNSGS